MHCSVIFSLSNFIVNLRLFPGKLLNIKLLLISLLQIPRSNEGREWFQYVDPRVTPQIIEGKNLNQLVNTFLLN